MRNWSDSIYGKQMYTIKMQVICCC